MPYDPATPAGQVRLLIADTGPDEVFTDPEVTSFLTMNGSNVKRAAAQALEVIAADEALTSKVISANGLSTNGAATADALRQLAASLRSEASNDADISSTQLPVYSFPDADARIDPTALGWL